MAMIEPGLEVREALPEELPAVAALHAVAWRETYPGLVPDELLAAITPERQTVARARFVESPDADGLLTFVATRNGSIVGFADGGRWRGPPPPLAGRAPDAEFFALYLLRSVQGHGLGLRLMQALAAALLDAGHRSAGVWVLAANRPARRFYERLGGEPAGERTGNRMGRALPAAAYFFHDLAALSGRPLRPRGG